MVSEKTVIKLLSAKVTDQKTKIKIAYSLGELKGRIPGSVRPVVVKRLLYMSADRDAKVRYASVSAMQNLYDTVSGRRKEKINERIYDLCADRNAWVLFGVREFIKKLNFQDRVTDRILKLSKSQYPGRRSKAVAIFRGTRMLIPGEKISKVVESISRLCVDEKLVVRISALREIKYAGRVPDNVQNKLNKALLTACEDSNWIVRYGSIRTICAQRDNFRGKIINKIFELMLKLCGDVKWEVRFSAVQGMERMRRIIPYNARSKIIAKVSDLSERDINKIVRDSAKKSLEKLQKI